MKFLLSILTLLACNYSTAKFSDKIKQSGIDFVHVNGMNGKFYMPEIFGSGVAFFDYDNDGDMDIYMVQSGYLPNSAKYSANYSDKLYRNDTKKQDQPIFVDVTKQAKITATGYGMGVAAGDLNNDGFVDLFVVNYGANQILMNNGDGTFSSPAKAININDKSWSVSASVADQNADGFLDVYVANYVNYSLAGLIKQCKAYDGSQDYCSPQSYTYQSDDLYKNNKDGTFSNISYKAGFSKFEAPGLGVVAADLNGDSKTDYYVANDGIDNHYWINKGNDEFVEFALASGIAVNMNGEPEASMGVDAADYDNDGDIDLFMTHLNRQTNTLYVNNGKGWFSDLTVAMKLGSSSYTSTGFGTFWFDYDNDGLLDLFAANGTVAKIPEQVQNNTIFPYKQSNQLWNNIGNGKYHEVSTRQSTGFIRKTVSRGAAFADIDNDGDLDILVSNNNGIPQLLINEIENNNNWIGLKVVNKTYNRAEIGAVVTLKHKNKKYLKQVKTDGSYESSHDDRIVFGLGSNSGTVDIEVRWTDGSNTAYKQLKINKYHLILK